MKHNDSTNTLRMDDWKHGSRWQLLLFPRMLFGFMISNVRKCWRMEISQKWVILNETTRASSVSQNHRSTFCNIIIFSFRAWHANQLVRSSIHTEQINSIHSIGFSISTRPYQSHNSIKSEWDPQLSSLSHHNHHGDSNHTYNAIIARSYSGRPRSNQFRKCKYEQHQNHQ